MAAAAAPTAEAMDARTMTVFGSNRLAGRAPKKLPEGPSVANFVAYREEVSAWAEAMVNAQGNGFLGPVVHDWEKDPLVDFANVFYSIGHSGDPWSASPRTMLNTISKMSLKQGGGPGDPPRTALGKQFDRYGWTHEWASAQPEYVRGVETREQAGPADLYFNEDRSKCDTVSVDVPTCHGDKGVFTDVSQSKVTITAPRCKADATGKGNFFMFLLVCSPPKKDTQNDRFMYTRKTKFTVNGTVREKTIPGYVVIMPGTICETAWLVGAREKAKAGGLTLGAYLATKMIACKKDKKGNPTFGKIRMYLTRVIGSTMMYNALVAYHGLSPEEAVAVLVARRNSARAAAIVGFCTPEKLKARDEELSVADKEVLEILSRAISNGRNADSRAALRAALLSKTTADALNIAIEMF